MFPSRCRSLLAVVALTGALAVGLASTSAAQDIQLACTPSSVSVGQASTCTATIDDFVPAPALFTVTFDSDLGGVSSPGCNFIDLALPGFEAACSAPVTFSVLGTHQLTATSGYCLFFPICPEIVSDPFTITVSNPEQLSPLPPVVTGLSASSGPAGTPVVISGDHFETTKKVLFGDVEATQVTDGYQHITAVAPEGPTGTVDVTVVNKNGTSEKVPADQFTYTPSAPTAVAGQQGDSNATRLCNVPNLVGKSYRGAKKAIVAAGCPLGALVHTGHAKRPPSHVLTQAPAAGSPLNAGDRLSITLG